MGMRRQPKSGGVVVQPNLLHMWDIKKNDINETATSQNIDRGDSYCTEPPNASGQSEAVQTANVHHSPVPQSQISNAQSEILETEPILTPKSFNTSLPERNEARGRVDEEATHVAVVQPVVNDVDRIITPPKVDLTLEESDEPQPLRRDGNKLTRSQTKESKPDTHQAKLFPIFEQKNGRQSKVSAAEMDKLRDAESSQRNRIRKVRKPQQRPESENLSRDITGKAASQTLQVGVLDGASAGPSSQPLLPLPAGGSTTSNKTTKQPLSSIVAGSQETPILIDSSPVRDTWESPASEPLSPIKSSRSVRGEMSNSFFAPRKPDPSRSSSKSRKKVGEGDTATWPDKDSQHLRGAQRSFPCTPLRFIRSRPNSCLEDQPTSLTDTLEFLHIDDTSYSNHEPRYLVEPIGSQPDGHVQCENILQSQATCPAISRLLSAGYDISGSSWNERWHPRSADEVIGNEASSRYLRDWLLALAIKTIDRDPPTEGGVVSSSNAEVTEAKSHNTKRPPVIRAVDKPRKRRRIDSDEESLDDWIASDDEEEEILSPFPAVEEVEEERSVGGGPTSPWRPKLTRLTRHPPPDNDRSNAHSNVKAAPHPEPVPGHDFSDRLTNTILLTGPSGSGKTAAVYACAEELGWEVFEVYPGIGKRNGTSLLSLVGDVGNNHIVSRSSRALASTREKEGCNPNIVKQTSTEVKIKAQKATSQGIAPFFRPNRQTLPRATTQEHAGPEQTFSLVREGGPSIGAPKVIEATTSLDTSAGNDRTSSPIEITNPKETGAQQSIILLEEVDILFGEDASFWPTVVALIRESRRPIILTCNDPNLVPSSSLPLQSTLTFNPCPPDLAVSYLRCMALTEGYTISQRHIETLYKSGCPTDALDTSDEFARSSVVPLPTPDLRHAINSLQFLCQGSSGFEEVKSTTSNITEASDKENDYSAQESSDKLSKLWSSDWLHPVRSDAETAYDGQDDRQRRSAQQIARVWQLCDTVSMIDSSLSRSPSACLELYSLVTGTSSDEEVGYRSLGDEPSIQHLQGGIVQYNYDEAIAAEAALCAQDLLKSDAPWLGTEDIMGVRTEGRSKWPTMELLDRPRHFERVSGVLDRIVPAASKECVGALILDYEPWVRTIDRTDMELEAAALKESSMRVGMRVGRITRNSQRTQYQRYFNLEEGQRRDWHSCALAW